MDKKRRKTGFFCKLAWSNVCHNRRTYLPYLAATAIISGVFLLISGLMSSDTLRNLPTGGTASLIFAMGMVIFAIFSFCFMVYVNNFLISRRRREFGLYGVLGLEKRHIGRVLLLENGIVFAAGLLIGCALALVFGRLVFWLLLRIIRAVPGSSFSLAPRAYLLTAGLFLATFTVTSLINLRQIRLASPMTLMTSEKRGEKESRAAWPLAVLGLAALLVAYYFAWTITLPSTALFTFFGLVALVILATFLLFTAGSVTLLKRLRANKRFYYQANHFVTVSGLLQRMKQNARSLAVICVLSTMLIVTVSGTLALYFGQEDMLSGMYPYDVTVYTADNPDDPDDPDDETLRAFEQVILALAKENRVTLSADPGKITPLPPVEARFTRNNYLPAGARQVPLQTLLYFYDGYRFDAKGETADCIAFVQDIRKAYGDTFAAIPRLMVSEVFTARQEGYGLYGGLLFLGAFFGLLFLAVTVLLIYFKQITEGYEDRARFVILQEVGMDDDMVKETINRQVLWVFFAPLGATVLHMVFASRIMARMLQSFVLYDWGLVLACIGGVLILFVLMYFVVFRATARVYYRIVRR